MRPRRVKRPKVDPGRAGFMCGVELFADQFGAGFGGFVRRCVDEAMGKYRSKTMDDKVSDDVLRERLEKCPPAGLYRHYKGGLYSVVGSAIREADLEPLVIYRPVGERVTFARPLSEWYEEVRYNRRVALRFVSAE